jgi:Enoyl-CoA hydratase/isomerase
MCAEYCVCVHVEGLFPDVAFAFLSAKVGMPLPVALFLGLTGTRLSDPADLLAAGLGTHFVHSSNLPELRKEILEASYCTDAKATLVGALHCLSLCLPPPALECS